MSMTSEANDVLILKYFHKLVDTLPSKICTFKFLPVKVYYA